MKDRIEGGKNVLQCCKQAGELADVGIATQLIFCGNRRVSNSSCSHHPPAIRGSHASFLVVFKIHCINSPCIE